MVWYVLDSSGSGEETVERALVNAAINFQFPQNVGEVLEWLLNCWPLE
jgi:hypothetical protein